MFQDWIQTLNPPHKHHKSWNKNLNLAQIDDRLKDQGPLKSKIRNLKQIIRSLKTPKLRLKIKRLFEDKKKALSISKTPNLMVINDFVSFDFFNPKRLIEIIKFTYFSNFFYFIHWIKFRGYC